MVHYRTKARKPGFDVIRAVGEIMNPEPSGCIRLRADEDLSVTGDDHLSPGQRLIASAVPDNARDIAADIMPCTAIVWCRRSPNGMRWCGRTVSRWRGERQHE